MNKKRILFLFIFGLIGFVSSDAQSNDKQETRFTEEGQVKVLYFHFTRRCKTCNAVEDVAKQTVLELNNDEIDFADYNLDNASGKEQGKKYKVSGQTLLIVSGNKKVNITTNAFMYARSNPDKLKALIKDEIEKLQQ